MLSKKTSLNSYFFKIKILLNFLVSFVLKNRILIYLLFLTYQILIRVHIIDNIITFLLPLSLIIIESSLIFLRKKNQIKFVIDKYQIICLVILLALIVINIFRLSSYSYLANLFVISTYPLMFMCGILFKLYFEEKFLYRQLFRWMIFSYFIDSIYIWFEIISRKLNIIKFTIFLQKPFVEGIFSSRFENSVTNSFTEMRFNELPLFLGTKGFPEFTIFLFLIFSIILINKFYRERKYFASYFLILNSLTLILFSNVTLMILILGLFIIYQLRPIKLRFLRKSDFYFIVIILISFFLGYLFIDKFGQRVDEKIFITFNNSEVNPLDKSRIQAIFNYKNFVVMFSRINFNEFLFGTVDIGKTRLNDLDLENEILNFAYCYGIIFFAAFATLNLRTIYLSSKAYGNKILKNYKNNLYLYNSLFLFVVLVDSLHFGQTFNIPDISIIALMTGLLSQASFEKKNYKL